MNSWNATINRPVQTLLLSFVAWKVLLLAIAVASPGLGYDTSTNLFLHDHGTRGHTSLPSAPYRVVERLTRWDAIYFVKTANRGHVLEQEWAFSWGYARFIALCATAFRKAGLQYDIGLEAVLAICLAHTAHLLSVLVLYYLTRVVFPGPSTRGFALTAALLHIISPAGLFLSAPYAESACSFLSFLGYFLFSKSLAVDGQQTIKHDFLILLSGFSFGLATICRSNGILNGILLLEEALHLLLKLQHGLNISVIRRGLATGLGGICVALGFLIPQYVAYQEFCQNPNHQLLRPWCERTIPSIYTFVQVHYWNNGFLRYWTVSNIPLFLLAAPMIAIMGISGMWALQSHSDASHTTSSGSSKVTTQGSEQTRARANTQGLLRRIAVPQLLLVVATIVNAHVQIITRLSSAYPVWLWYIAGKAAAFGPQKRQSSYLIRFMIMYAVIQGGLFSSFLPPA
ncbi:GPI mannosyltransferase 2 [Xylogone sp. PMI_703]|nr:GPI mannosyltransferase 2 [Xylogone sp. PMI_703]